MRPIDPRATVDFVCECDRDLPLPPESDPAARQRVEEANVKRRRERVVFVLGVPRMLHWSMIQDLAFKDGAYRSGTDQRLSVMYGLRGWKGADGGRPEGWPEFKAREDGLPTEETLDVIPRDALAPLAAAVADLCKIVSGDDLGK